MIKRYFLLFNGFILLVAVASPTVHAWEKYGDHHHRRRNKEVRVNWRFAGAFYNGVVQADSDDPMFLFHTEVKGSPGPATIVGINQGPGDGVETIPVTDDPDCFEGANFKQIPISQGPPLNENSLVATFEDLSVLNMALDETRRAEAFNCLSVILPSFEVTRFDFVIPINFVGGFGRFDGATGEGIIKGQSMPIVPGSNFGSETGTIKGTIILP